VFTNIKKQATDPEIIKLLSACIYEYSIERATAEAKNYQLHDERFLYGWLENDKILAVCGGELQSGVVIIRHISACENLRGQGIGSKMISALQWQYNLPIQAETDDDAIDFYRKCGFETTVIRKHNMRRWVCLLPVNIT